LRGHGQLGELVGPAADVLVLGLVADGGRGVLPTGRGAVGPADGRAGGGGHGRLPSKIGHLYLYIQSTGAVQGLEAGFEEKPLAGPRYRVYRRGRRRRREVPDADAAIKSPRHRTPGG